MKTHFKHCSFENHKGTLLADFKITADSEDCISASVDGSDLFSRLSYESALNHLMQDVLTRLNGASRTSLVFHAAALAHAGGGLILCGRSGSGKSSLAAWLAASGMQYLTDEVISCPLNGNTFSGFPRSMVLKRGSAFIWRRWVEDANDDPQKFRDGSVWARPEMFNSATVEREALPRLLIFPRYEKGEELQVEKISAADALFQLMQNLVNARNFPDHGMSTAARIVQQAPAFRMTYSDIETATQWIKETMTTG
ncbi:MAG: hypothetical protein HYZ21_06255 [Chloroflexi bacterium]|nr:hypothetical protein [Chloroflexota bacterium]